MKRIRKLWSFFEEGMQYLMDDDNTQGVAKIRKDIKDTLNEIVEILWDEDLENRHERTIGDCLEFFLSNNMLEIITAYTKADKPKGFFKIGLNALIKIVQGITSASILSQSNVHQAILMLFNSIHITLWHQSEYLNYEEKNKLSSDLLEVINFVTAVTLKAYNEPYIVNLFFTNVKKLPNKKSERGDYLPLKILLVILKEFKSFEEWKEYIEQCYYTIKIILRTNSKPLDEYIMNDSELIEILMAKLTGFYSSLPERVSKKKKMIFKKNKIKRRHPKNNEEGKEHVGVKIKKISYTNTWTECVGIRDMIVDIFGTGDLLQNFDTFSSFFSFFNEVVSWTLNKTMVDNLVNKFFNEFLLDKIQPILLNVDDNIAKRAWIQYYVHMVHLSNSYKIIEILFFFLFGFPKEFKPVEEENKEMDYDAPQPHIENETENINDIMNDLVVVGDEKDININSNDYEVEVHLYDSPDEDHEILVGAPMIWIGNQIVSGPLKQNQINKEPRGRKSRRSDNPQKVKKGRSVSVLAIK